MITAFGSIEARWGDGWGILLSHEAFSRRLLLLIERALEEKLLRTEVRFAARDRDPTALTRSWQKRHDAARFALLVFAESDVNVLLTGRWQAGSHCSDPPLPG
jgi:hypothetical protein